VSPLYLSERGDILGFEEIRPAERLGWQTVRCNQSANTLGTYSQAFRGLFDR
jgi:hypothetical protein